LRLPRFFPFGQPPSLALARAALVLALDFALPSNAPMFISFPQCGHFMSRNLQRSTPMNHAQIQSSPLPEAMNKHPGFKSAAASIARRQGIPVARANAILASQTRGASAAAKRHNPRLKRVHGR
jgi:hypothetical protein